MMHTSHSGFVLTCLVAAMTSLSSCQKQRGSDPHIPRKVIDLSTTITPDLPVRKPLACAPRVPAARNPCD